MKTRVFTFQQSFALSLVFQEMGESRSHRSYDEYMAIAARLPPLKVLHPRINERLRRFHSEYPEARWCRFKPGDRTHWYERYPESLSSETVRAALVNSGMRTPRARRARKTLPTI